jgi:hypothetical protein
MAGRAKQNNFFQFFNARAPTFRAERKGDLGGFCPALSFQFPLFSLALAAVFRKAKCAAREDVALAPTHLYIGNTKELPKKLS